MARSPLSVCRSFVLRSSKVAIAVLFVANARCLGSETPPPATANHLIHEKSPYLLQHAHNPVDWYPWGEEAFAKARAENKPIFLSVGYSTCHWCHVMEHESFEDPGTARLLNESFVSIKVDREERPDIDRVYMSFVEASTGSGGWPMSVWLTPDLKPFFGGTYFPRDDAGDRPGFRSLLVRIATMWAKQRGSVQQQADDMMRALKANTQPAAAPAPGGGEKPSPRARLLAEVARQFDATHGGFGTAPKFPQPSVLDFLFEEHATSAVSEKKIASLNMALKTLRSMADGGIHDQLGGGFHRYAVDEAWRVPHFEKMLYDQAQLTIDYLDAGLFSPDPIFDQTARDILACVGASMTDAGGAFYSAEDADSVLASNPSLHGEGAYYVWQKSEIESLLDARELSVVEYRYGIRGTGNVEDDPNDDFGSDNVLFNNETDAETASRLAISIDEAGRVMASIRKKLLAARETRPHPLRDDKINTAWNGLMISAYARAAQILDDPAYAVSAQRAAAFLRAHLFDATTGRLAHSFRDGTREARGFLEDYAFLIQGLLDLYETDFDVSWLQWAEQLQARQDELFWDEKGGGYFSNTGDDPSVLLRLKSDNDGAEPSGNSVAVRNLARLSTMLHRDSWRARAVETAKAFASTLDRTPAAMPQLVTAMDWLEGAPRQILITGEPSAPATKALLAEVRRHFNAHSVVVCIDAASRPFFAKEVELVREIPPEKADGATAYVCENFVCHLPTSDRAELAKLLGANPLRKE